MLMTSCLCVFFINKTVLSSKYCTWQEDSQCDDQTPTLVHIPLSLRLTTNVLVNVVVRVGVAKARVPGLASQRAWLRRQTRRILVLKGLPVSKGGWESKVVKRGVLACFFF